MGRRAVSRDKPPWLSPREIEVIEAIIKYGDQTRAARALGISPYTARNHLGTIRMVYGVDSTLKAAIAYDRWKYGRSAEIQDGSTGDSS